MKGLANKNGSVLANCEHLNNISIKQYILVKTCSMMYHLSMNFKCLENLIGGRTHQQQLRRISSNEMPSRQLEKVIVIYEEDGYGGDVGSISLSSEASLGCHISTGLPSFVAFPKGCKSVECLIRYEGELSVDSVIDWFATPVLGLPRIPYYSKETLRTRTPQLVPNDSEPIWTGGENGSHGCCVVKDIQITPSGYHSMSSSTSTDNNVLCCKAVPWCKESYNCRRAK